ncbi:hypothetical protein [Sphingobium chlorophenolicum]|uniref:hypothetical protein n=1 Tax=Sphingobium chlorophenolicum TaxID=46429 RepID=UPI00117EE9A6|nr:hypothetical protein [Sphingobium chlorophenolicum]
MRRAFHFLILAAVLWCGLHLSPAEADAFVPATLSTSATAQQADHDGLGDHPMRQAPHGCHSHCPVATDTASGPALSMPVPARSAFFPTPDTRLTSFAPAPPIEPPSA